MLHYKYCCKQQPLRNLDMDIQRSDPEPCKLFVIHETSYKALKFGFTFSVEELVKVTEFPVLLRWLLCGFRSSTHFMHRIFLLLLVRQNLLNSNQITSSSSYPRQSENHGKISYFLASKRKPTHCEKKQSTILLSSTFLKAQLQRNALHWLTSGISHPQKPQRGHAYPRSRFRRRFSVLRSKHCPSKPSRDAFGPFHF